MPDTLLEISKRLSQSESPLKQAIQGDGNRSLLDISNEMKDINPATPTPGFGGAVMSVISPITEFISRPQFASAAFFDGLMDESKGIFDIISDSFNEIVNPKLKLSFADIIRKRAPEFAKNNPKATAVLGFALDVGADPTSYLGIGLAGKGIKVGTQILNKAGTALRAGMIAEELNRGRQVISAIGKNVQRDVFRATQRGISATAQELRPFRVAREIVTLSKEYADELTQLGIPFDKQSVRKLAFDELGIDAIPLPKMLGGKPLSAKRVTGLISGIVDNISTELEKTLKIGRELPKPLPLVPGAEIPGAAKTIRTPVFGKKKPLPKTRKGEDVTRKTEVPEREFESSTGIVEQRFPDVEEVRLLAGKLVRTALGKFKPGKNASPEQIQNLNSLVGEMVNSYVTTATKLIEREESVRGFTNTFKESLFKRLQRERADRVIGPNPLKRTKSKFEGELPFESASDEPFDLTPLKATKVAGKLAAREKVMFERGVIRNFSIDEVYEHVEKRIQRLADFDPKIAKQIFKEPKTTLRVGIPFTKIQADVLNLTALAPLKRSIDFVAKLNDAVIGANVPVISQTARFARNAGRFTGAALTGLKETAEGLFVRPGGPFGAVVKEFQNQYDYIEGQMFRESKRLFQVINRNPEAKERMTSFLREVDDRTRKIEFIEDRVVTQSEADEIFYDAMTKARISLPSKLDQGRTVGLTAEEVSIIAGMKQEFANSAALEIEASLLKAEIKNYLPRYYDALDNGKDMAAISRYKYGLSTQLTSSQRRKYITLAEAEDAGLIPEMDASLIYATRVASSRRALAKKQFFESLSEAVGLDIKNQNDLPKLLQLKEGKRYLNDIKLLGESVYPTGMNTNVRNLIKFIDHLNGFFRKGATVAKLSFAPKQFISNTAQAMLELGLKGGKTFDLRVIPDAAGLVMDFYRGKPLAKPPKVVENYMIKHVGRGTNNSDSVMAMRTVMENILGEEQLTEFAKGFKRVTVTGAEFGGQDLTRLMRELNIIRGVDAVGNTFKKNLEQFLNYDPKGNVLIRRKGGAKNIELPFKQATLEFMKYWKYPSMVEDHARATHFLTFLSQGYSPKQAADMVNEVLFDYQHGLSFLEKNVIRRMIPFYTFQRFAIPFVMKKMIQEPGKVAAFNKVMGLAERLWVSPEDTLNPSEREVFGESFYVEQPRMFLGFDKEGAAKFNILNNLTPLDALSLFVYDTKTNEIDLARTAQKTILAAFTPYLKVPLEIAVDKNFFTGQAQSQGIKLGNLKETTGLVLPDFVKDAIGWEDRVNLRTGKTSTYINSYFGYFMASVVPALKQFINFGDQDRSILDKSIEIVVGVSPKGVDLKEMRQWQSLSDTKRIREFTSSIRTAKIKGADTAYEEHFADFREFLEVVKQGNAIKNQDQIRGLGIAGQRTQQLDQEQR